MRRVSRDERFAETIEALTTGDVPVFRELWRVLNFAAFVGIYFDNRLPLEKIDHGKSIPSHYFGNLNWIGFLYLMSIYTTNDTNCLSTTVDNEEHLVTVFEEYANGGLQILTTRLLSAGEPVDVVSTLVLEAGQPKHKDINIDLTI
jgi:dnd system-associated protein 4